MIKMLKLGLIGDNIDHSQSPHLHRTCGRMAGIDVSYEPLVPHAMGMSFEESAVRQMRTSICSPAFSIC